MAQPSVLFDTAGEAGAAVAEEATPALAVYDDLDSIADLWRDFERRAVRTIYQRYDWISAWHRHLGAAAGVKPRIVVGTRAGAPVFLLPLGIERRGLLNVGTWLGGSHVNFNMGLFDECYARSVAARDIDALITAIARAIGPVDYFVLCCQPLVWNGVPNPLAKTPGITPLAPVPSMALAGDFAETLARHDGKKKRKKHRWQENTLAPHGGYRFLRGATPDEARMLLREFLVQKQERLRHAGLKNAFAGPGVEALFDDLIRASAGADEPTIVFFGIEVEGKIRATFAGGVERGRLCGYFNAFAEDELARVSPGELLLYKVIEEAHARGLQWLDLGVGEERYKTSWLDVEEPQFSSFIPVTGLGFLAANAARLVETAKVAIRTNPRLWPYFKALRRTLRATR